MRCSYIFLSWSKLYNHLFRPETTALDTCPTHVQHTSPVCGCFNDHRVDGSGVESWGMNETRHSAVVTHMPRACGVLSATQLGNAGDWYTLEQTYMRID